MISLWEIDRGSCADIAEKDRVLRSGGDRRMEVGRKARLPRAPRVMRGSLAASAVL